MNRRKFVRSFGISTLISDLVLKGRTSSLSGVFGATKWDKKSLIFAGEGSEPSPLWPRPRIIPIPTAVAGVPNYVVDLGGKWKFALNPPPEFWADGAGSANWVNVEVPGELTAQGVPIVRDSEYAYQRAMTIPAAAKGNRVLLRFDGVYSYARVWVNGKFVREHHGGFTSWDCDIAPFVTLGETARLTLGVTDRADEISYASSYAKHNIGGILRSVKLVILPPNHIARLHVETSFDSAYKDGHLRIKASVVAQGNRKAFLKLYLKDPLGKAVPLSGQEAISVAFSAGMPDGDLNVQVPSPLKWDSEHPNLYALAAELMVDGATVERLEKSIGFCQVERRGNRLYVNGDAVKLRGVCRHDTHPLRGRSVTPEIDMQDALLLRDANVNFVRTSHYPPTESFLDACDRVGIYVEEETAVCFVSQERSVIPSAESNSDATSRYMNQFAEMIERDRSHPSVILWSLGNESRWGANFAKEREYVKAEDRTRPTIFSYPDNVPAGVDAYDIYSKHYPKFDGDLTSQVFPKLNDECTHIACYNVDTLKRDPGVRNHWGEFIKRFWENAYASEGCLGGAIWAGFEEVFLLPDTPVGYGEWGIVDGWRRLKPEFWLTKKAYSPVCITEDELPNPGPGQPLLIPVKNWFNHTNLSEIKVECRAGGTTPFDIPERSVSIPVQVLFPPAINVAPGAEGVIRVPARSWYDGEVVELLFHGAAGNLIDEFRFRIGKRVVTFPGRQAPAPRVTEDTQSLTVQGPDFSVVFSKASGLISEGVFRDKKIIEGGPFLNLGTPGLSPWWLLDMRHSVTAEEVVINLEGAHIARQGSGPGMNAAIEIRINSRGLITAEYTLRGPVKATNEVGLSYVLSSSIGYFRWDRKALWSAYPDDHIGRPIGTAMRHSTLAAQTYRQPPAGPWSEDTQDFFLFGPNDTGGRGTNDFRSLKENIWYASCGLGDVTGQVRAESDGSAAARAEVRTDGKVQFYIDNLWSYPDLSYGVSMSPITLEQGYKNAVRLRLMAS